VKNHYDVIGLSKTATQGEILAAYRTRMKLLHPDRLDPMRQRKEWNLANELLKELNQAFAVLRDPAKRAAYDRAMAGGSPGLSVSPQTPGAASAANKRHQREEDNSYGVYASAIQGRERFCSARTVGVVAVTAAVGVAVIAFLARSPWKPRPVRVRSGLTDLTAAPFQSRSNPSPIIPTSDPANGKIFKNELRSGHGKLRIVNATRSHAVAKLVSSSTNHSVFTVFVGAGEQYTITSIPNGSYRLAFAQGRKWNWVSDGFDESGDSSVFRNPFEFDVTEAKEGNDTVAYYRTFEVTLQPTAGGTARTDEVASDVFEKL
jgi:hypothetical protein